MATQVLTEAAVWFDKVAIHDVADTLQLATAREPKGATTFGAKARHMRVGLFTVSVSASGFADMTDFDDDLFDLYNNSTTGPISVTETGGDGDIAYTTRALTSTLSPLGGSVGDMAAVSLQADGRGGIRPVRGTILHPETARTSTGDGTARELGAVSSTQTVYAALHVVAASGSSPTLDVIVESDTEEAFGDTPETQITFTQATDRTAEWQSAAGAVTDTWWRAGWTIGGTDPSFTFVVVVGIATT